MKLYPKNKKTKMDKFFVLPLYIYIYWEKIVLGYDHMKFNYFDKTLLNHEYHDDLCHYIYFKKYIFLFIFLA